MKKQSAKDKKISSIFFESFRKTAAELELPDESQTDGKQKYKKVSLPKAGKGKNTPGEPDGTYSYTN